jgi:hypothetical protein
MDVKWTSHHLRALAPPKEQHKRNDNTNKCHRSKCTRAAYLLMPASTLLLKSASE